MNRDSVSAIAAAVHRRRRELSLTQEELADLAGCRRLFVSELENGKSTVRVDKLLGVLRVLGLQLSIENGTGGFVDTTDASN